MKKKEIDAAAEARNVILTEADALRDMAGRITQDFSRAVDMIAASKGRLIVTGMGKSGLVGQKVAATLASTGTPSFFLHPAEASHGDLGMVTREDIVLAISNSGSTEEIVNILPTLKRFGVGLISMTGNAESVLGRASDVHLDVAVSKEACPLGIVPTASTTAALAMGDALAVALLLKSGFSEEDFAAFHPRGALGKKLLIRVSDLMHAKDAMPRVSPTMPMRHALIEISTKRLGLTTVVDQSGALLGVITDGDLRRAIETHGGKLFDLTAQDIMGKSPRTISEDELAAAALARMEAHAITALVALNESGYPVGVIHIHDILKEGIA